RSQENAAFYNTYHKDVRRNPDKALSDFHIAFLNSRKECDRTDSPSLRKNFLVDNDEVFRAPSPLARIIGGLFGSSSAIAAAGPYKRISIEISNGEFINSLFAGSFSVPAGKRHDIVVRDLSTYLKADSGRRRSAIRFSITD